MIYRIHTCQKDVVITDILYFNVLINVFDFHKLYWMLCLQDNSDPFMMTRLLEEVQPKYIIMYDSDLTFIRQVEVL